MRGNGVDAGEELVQRRRKSRLRIAEQVVELRKLACQRTELGRLRTRRQHLRGEEVAVDAAYAGDIDAPAVEAAAEELRQLGRDQRFLARKAGRVDVADVVAGRDQPCLGGVQTGKANAEDAVGHLCQAALRAL